MDDRSRILVGAIAGAFGVAGEVRLKSFCADPAAIADYAPLTDEAGRVVRLRLTRAVKGGFAARIEGVATREAAEALRGVRLYAERARLPALPEDEFYHADLIGLEVLDPGGARLGRVKAVHDFGAGDVLEIAGAGPSLMLPFTREVVPTLDLAAGRLIADPPPGALPGGAPEAGAGEDGDGAAAEDADAGDDGRRDADDAAEGAA